LTESGFNFLTFQSQQSMNRKISIGNFYKC
jgi:hypothetical protein